MTEWQPIETVPKNKKPILVLRDSYVMMAYFNIVTVQWEVVRYIWSDGLMKKCLQENEFKKEFTHWMPLPEPPKDNNDV